jgi:hypothetical protein
MKEQEGVVVAAAGGERGVDGGTSQKNKSQPSTVTSHLNKTSFIQMPHRCCYLIKDM